MRMTPPQQRLMLVAHVTASVGWTGALAVFLAHAVASVASTDARVVSAACIAMGLSAWFVIFPLSLLSLATGLIQALGTAWGLFRHYWVLFKLLLTVVATAVLLLKLAPIRYLADAAAQLTSLDSSSLEARISLLLHAVGGLAFLLAATVLAIYKPAGAVTLGAPLSRDTPVARRSHWREVPRWVKLSGVTALLLALLVLSAVLFGTHGPGMHAPR